MAMSSVPDSRASSTASAACTTMNSVAFVRRERAGRVRRGCRRRPRTSTVPPAKRLPGRARPVRRQVQLVGQRRRARAPVVELLGGTRCRVGLGAEHRALPEREVGVLHRQRRPAAAPRPRRARRRRVITSRVSGPIDAAVGADVVHHEDEHVLVVGDASGSSARRVTGRASAVTSNAARDQLRARTRRSLGRRRHRRSRSVEVDCPRDRAGITC